MRKSRAGNLNPSWKEEIHNIPCMCGCGLLLKSYHERKNGYIAYHNKERVSNARSENAKKAIIKTKKILFEKYGVENPAKVEGAMDKRESTWMEKYNVRNVVAFKKRKSTSIEDKIECLLKENNIKYEKEYNVLGWIIDYAILHKKVIIECDGDYWHSKENVIKNDKRKDKEFIKNGWNVLRFTETEINENINKCLIKINKACV